MSPELKEATTEAAKFGLLLSGIVVFSAGFLGYVSFEAPTYGCEICTLTDLKSMTVELFIHGLGPLLTMLGGAVLMVMGSGPKEAST